MIPRSLKAVLEKSPKSVLVLGPRQVGKSTLIESLEPDITLNLNDEKTFLDIKSNPNELKERLLGSKAKTIFIDEIQRHPALLNTIQTLLDSKEYKSHLKFYLSGSSARKLKRGQANLLPGRLFHYVMGPLVSAELDYQLDVKRALKYGCLPEPYLTKDNQITEKMLTTYSGVYLKEEILAEALTRNIDGFSRFIFAAANGSGSVLDFSKIAHQAKIERKQCAQFYEILEDTLIANRLEVFAKTKSDIKKRPKYFFFDTGVLNGLLENFTVSEDRKGFLFEHLVANQILASANARDRSIKLSYFRTRSGFEVDFILEIENKVFAIEAKTGNVSRHDANHLTTFKGHYSKVTHLFIVLPETEEKTIEGVTVCSLSALLKKLGL